MKKNGLKQYWDLKDKNLFIAFHFFQTEFSITRTGCPGDRTVPADEGQAGEPGEQQPVQEPLPEVLIHRHVPSQTRGPLLNLDATLT